MKTTLPTIRLLLLLGLLAAVRPAAAQTWTLQTNAPSTGNTTWTSIASSADGSKLIAAFLGFAHAYYTSTNSGAAWTSNSMPQMFPSWNRIACSADGSILVASSVSSVIWVSTNSGTSWLSNNVTGVTEWSAVASSADGNKLLAADGSDFSYPGLIYISTNWGITWSPTSAPTNSWTSVASSADGTKLVATTWNSQARAGLIGGSGGYIYASTNAGLTWAPTGAPTNSGWTAIASSADGCKLVAANNPLLSNTAPYTIVSPGLIYTSTNSGATWVSNNVPDNLWEGVASSADGSRLIVTGQGNPSGIYTSTNSGATWTSNNIPAPPTYSIYSIASSADGSILMAGGDGGGIYTLQTTVSPQLNLAPSSTNLTLLAWTVPSTNFVLQQSADLSAWLDVTNPPVLNLTNLQNQVTLTLSNPASFFRLKTP